MFLTRDKNSLGKICLWIDVKREDLCLRESDGNWVVTGKYVPRVMEIDNGGIMDKFLKV